MLGQIAGTPEAQLKNGGTTFVLRVTITNKRFCNNTYSLINGEEFLDLMEVHHGTRSMSPEPKDWPIGHMYVITPLRVAFKVDQEC